MQPISNTPCLLINKTLIIADLHIGIEKEFKQKGIHIPSNTKNMLNEIINLKNKYKINHIIINGDFKHNIPLTSFQELREIPEFVKHLNCKINFVIGNHDSNLKKILKNFDNIKFNKSLIIDNFGFFHGHSWAKEIFFCEKIISAHLHPMISLYDIAKIKTNFPCWIRAKFKKNAINFLQKKFNFSKKEKRLFMKNYNKKYIIIMPPFNKLIYGKSINLQSKFGILLRNNLIDINNAKIYLLNGFEIGKLKDYYFGL